MRTALLLIAMVTPQLWGCGDDSPSDDHACTLIGCGPAFEVVFQKSSGWPDSTYTVRVTADGVVTSCEAAIPLSCDVGPTCDRDDVPFLLTLSGCALDRSQHALGGVLFPQVTPSSVEVQVLAGQQSLGSDGYSPEYVTSQPNGPGCEPICHSAGTETLVLQ